MTIVFCRFRPLVAMIFSLLVVRNFGGDSMLALIAVPFRQRSLSEW